MGFIRKDIKTTSTFNQDGVEHVVTEPSFSVWTNLSDLTHRIWKLTDNWTITIDSSDDLVYKYKENPKLTINSSGFTIGGLQITSLGELPDVSGYNTGDVINVSGVLYVLGS